MWFQYARFMVGDFFEMAVYNRGRQGCGRT